MLMRDPDLYSAKERLFLQTKNGIFTNFPLRPAQFQSLKKLKYLAVLRAADQKEATKYNLSYLSNQIFHKDIVNIVHQTAVFDSNRQRRETRLFFEENIIAEGSHLMAAPRVTQNLATALSPENIHKYMSNITGYGTENIKFADLVEKERKDLEQRPQKSAILRDEAIINLIEMNKELLEQLRQARPNMQLKTPESLNVIEAENFVPKQEISKQHKPQNVFEMKLLESKKQERMWA